MKALAGAGPGTDDVGLATLGNRQRLLLVTVQPQCRPEEARGSWSEHAPVRQLAEGRARLEGRIQLQYGIRPQLSIVEPRVDELPDSVIEDVDEALEVAAVIPDHPVLEREDIERHPVPLF